MRRILELGRRFARHEVFWAVFVILGVATIVTSIFNIFFLDILLGLMVIAIGLEKLDQELHAKEADRELNRTMQSLRHMTDWMNDTHIFARKLRDHSEYRLFRADQKRKDIEQDMEKRYRELVAKILSLENDFKQAAMSFSRGEEIRSGRESRVVEAVKAELDERDKVHARASKDLKKEISKLDTKIKRTEEKLKKVRDQARKSR